MKYNLKIFGNCDNLIAKLDEVSEWALENKKNEWFPSRVDVLQKLSSLLCELGRLGFDTSLSLVRSYSEFLESSDTFSLNVHYGQKRLSRLIIAWYGNSLPENIDRFYDPIILFCSDVAKWIKRHLQIESSIIDFSF